MSGYSLGLFIVALLIVLLFLLSVLESAIFGLSRLSTKVLAEREKEAKFRLLRDIAADRILFVLPLKFGAQLSVVISAVLITWMFFTSDLPYAPAWALAVMVAIIALFRQLFPRMITQSEPEQVLLRFLPLFRRFYPFLCWLSSPLITLLRISKASREDNQVASGPEEEATEEEIQAYLGVGEEEGIIEEEESRLIQSALEFGDLLAREIMTPRTEIVAIEEKATIAELKDLMVSSKFSRILVYREQLDQAIGVVYVRNFLSYLGDGAGEEPITPLIHKAWFVPETKKVSELLKEMQHNAEHLAILINEYGSVSGLVTMEDMIEELVGEIRDEDELEKIDLTYAGDGSYIVSGGAEIEELEETLGVDFGDLAVTTVSGLIVGHLGKVPTAGETVVLDGLSVEILSADRKRIQSMRVRKSEPEGALPLEREGRVSNENRRAKRK
ncbi:MAG: HlyC/CorC family transporter [Acidobacteria bacterium]|nr:HlyC/CorC family transporter [Acidobacteriota bacterium]